MEPYPNNGDLIARRVAGGVRVNIYLGMPDNPHWQRVPTRLNTIVGYFPSFSAAFDYCDVEWPERIIWVADNLIFGGAE